MVDIIHIHGLSVHVNIGCTAEERAFPQRLELDLQICVPQNPSRRKGELEGTVCYATATSLTEEIAGSESWVLVEDLADAVVEALFAEFAIATEINLQIRKRAVPRTAWTGIEVRRQRPR